METLTCPHCGETHDYVHGDETGTFWVAGVVTYTCKTCLSEIAVRFDSPVSSHPSPPGTVFANVDAYRDAYVSDDDL